jgi:hypothetical protein
MSELIADSLIIKEIVLRLNLDDGKESMENVDVKPFEIFQEVSSEIERLADRKTPIIHLDMTLRDHKKYYVCKYS